VQARQRLHGHAQLARRRHDRAAELTRGRWDRNQDLVRLVVAQQVRQVGGRAEHADAVDADVLLARVVIDEADRRVAELRVAVHLADRVARRFAGSDHEHLLAARDEAARRRPLEHRPREQPRPGDEREQDQPVHHRDRAREADIGHRRGEVDGDVGDERSDRDAARRSPHVAGGHVAPPAVVEAEEDEDQQLDPHDDQQRPLEEGVVIRRHAVVEAQLERQPPRGRNQQTIRNELPDPVAVDRDHEAAAPTVEASRTTLTTRS